MVHNHFICLDLRFLFCKTGGLNKTSASPICHPQGKWRKSKYSGGRGLGCSLNQLAESIAFL